MAEEEAVAEHVGAVSKAAKESEIDLLLAMRDLIAERLDAGVSSRDLASLTKRLREIQQDILSMTRDADSDLILAASAAEDEAWDGS